MKRDRSFVALSLALGVVLAAVCFRTVLFQGGQFGYRDIAHFYYPLYLRVQQEWAAGRIPLWEPEENGGVPLIGNPTAAVLYPGKLIFAALPYAWGLRIYVIAHVVLAFVTAVLLARSWQISRAGALIAGLSYAYGAPVLFQYSNVIYLVGAAWLPLGVRATDQWVRGRRAGAIPVLGLVLGLQTLGGDPQSAYLTLVCGAAYALGLAAVKRFGPPKPIHALGVLAVLAAVWSTSVLFAARLAHGPDGPAAGLPGWLPSASTVCGLLIACVIAAALTTARHAALVRELRPALGGLAFGSVLAAGLAAAQVIPAAEYARASLRALERGPVEIYPFSVEPYRMAELAWPGLFGGASPESASWLPTIQPFTSHESWSPSLYVGGFVLVLALSAAGWRSGPPWRVWLTIIGTISLLAALGRYGSPLWLARFIPGAASQLGPHDPPFVGAFRPDGKPLDGTGGVYWLLATVLPGFGMFRFPAKLLTFTSLSISILAGLGWDRIMSGSAKRAMLGCTTIALVSGLSLIVSFAGRNAIVTFWTERAFAAGSSLGPLLPEQAIVELRRTLVYSGGLALIAIPFAFTAKRRPRTASLLVVAMTASDLVLANSRLVWSVPQERFDRVPEALRRIQEAERDRPSGGPFRIHRMPHWQPHAWPRTASTERLAEIVTWERDTLQPLYGLPAHASYTMTKGALELYDYLWFFRPRVVAASGAIAELVGVEQGQPLLYYPRRGFDLWGTRYYILPVRADGWAEEDRAYAAFLQDVEMLYPDLAAFPGSDADRAQAMERWKNEADWQIFRSKTAYPRAWIVHEARILKPITGLKPADRERPMRLLLFQNDALWNDPSLPVLDTRDMALIECDDRHELDRYLPGRSPEDSEFVHVLEHTPQRVVLEAALTRPGLVILADVFYPGWQLEIDGRPAPILRANRMMRGAAVTAGRHRLVYRYAPLSFRIGALISVAAIGVLSIMLVRVARIQRAETRARNLHSPTRGVDGHDKHL